MMANSYKYIYLKIKMFIMLKSLGKMDNQKVNLDWMLSYHRNFLKRSLKNMQQLMKKGLLDWGNLDILSQFWLKLIIKISKQQKNGLLGVKRMNFNILNTFLWKLENN